MRSCRLVHHPARIHDRHARAFLSLTHHWTRRSSGSGTYVVRDLLDLFAEMVAAEGDFEWGLAYHLHRYQDMPDREGGLRLGIIDEFGGRKLGWSAYADLGTEREADWIALAEEAIRAPLPGTP